VAPDDLIEQARSVLIGERTALADRMEELGAAAGSIRQLLEELEGELADGARRLRALDEHLGLTPQLPLSAFDRALSGQQLRQAAVEVLRQHGRPGESIHYRQWLDLLLQTGARVAGKNPTATFLTQINRAHEIEPVRARSGLYRLKPG
jgi:hypothetical protein